MLFTLTKEALNPFHATAIFLYHLKTSENQIFIPNMGKYGPEKTPYLDIFCAMVFGKIFEQKFFENILINSHKAADIYFFKANNGTTINCVKFPSS